MKDCSTDKRTMENNGYKTLIRYLRKQTEGEKRAKNSIKKANSSEHK